MQELNFIALSKVIERIGCDINQINVVDLDNVKILEDTHIIRPLDIDSNSVVIMYIPHIVTQYRKVYLRYVEEVKDIHVCSEAIYCRYCKQTRTLQTFSIHKLIYTCDTAFCNMKRFKRIANYKLRGIQRKCKHCKTEIPLSDIPFSLRTVCRNPKCVDKESGLTHYIENAHLLRTKTKAELIRSGNYAINHKGEIHKLLKNK